MNKMGGYLFKGKRKSDGKWVTGYYINTHGTHRIAYVDYEGLYHEDEVFFDSLRRESTLKDENGEYMFEGDKVRVVEVKYANCKRKKIIDKVEYEGQLTFYQNSWCILIPIENGYSIKNMFFANLKDDEKDPDTYFFFKE